MLGGDNMIVPHITNAYIGVDNGVTGTIGGHFNGETRFIKTPSFKEQNYQKKKVNVTRLNVLEFRKFLVYYAKRADFVRVVIERPMVNPRNFVATGSALRCLEATLIVIEQVNRRYSNVSYEFIDSREWQSSLLPRNIKGSAALKMASMQKAIKLYPEHEVLLRKHKDGDGLLMMKYYMEKEIKYGR